MNTNMNDFWNSKTGLEIASGDSAAYACSYGQSVASATESPQEATDPSLALVENEHTAKHRAEALAQGLTLLSKSVRGKDYRRYEFNACGHVEDIPPSGVRKGEFKCGECLAQRWIDEAADQGLTLLGKSARGSDYRLYKCLACQHEAEIQVSDVRRGSFKCSRCSQFKISEEAMYNGLCLLGKSARGSAYRSYRLPCGHECSIRPEDVRTVEYMYRLKQRTMLGKITRSSRLARCGRALLSVTLSACSKQ